MTIENHSPLFSEAPTVQDLKSFLNLQSLTDTSTHLLGENILEQQTEIDKNDWKNSLI